MRIRPIETEAGATRTLRYRIYQDGALKDLTGLTPVVQIVNRDTGETMIAKEGAVEDGSIISFEVTVPAAPAAGIMGIALYGVDDKKIPVTQAEGVQFTVLAARVTGRPAA